MKPTTRCLTAALLALSLSFPLVLRLMATGTQPPPVVIVDPIPPGIPPTPLEPIYNNLIIDTRIYAFVANECAMQSISTRGEVVASSGANVLFAAGKQIHLMPGFHAAAGSKFRAQIGIDLGSINLNRPTESTGVPIGLTLDSNGNGIPDLIESNLGLNPAADNSNNPILQNLIHQYQYDANGQLYKILSPEMRTYDMDAEGNIKSN